MLYSLRHWAKDAALRWPHAGPGDRGRGRARGAFARVSNAPKGNGIGATGSWNQTRFLEPGAKGS